MCVLAERMLSLSRAVVSGVARAPAAVSQGGVTAITRYNSTAQVPDLCLIKTMKQIEVLTARATFILLLFFLQSAPKKTKFGPLADQDRIFTNLYGRHEWR